MVRMSYLNLLAARRVLNLRIAKERLRLGRRFCAEHKWHFRLIDAMFVMAILMNFGALIITNSLVVHKTPDITFYEVNPVQAELNDFEPHPETMTLYAKFLWQALMWLAIVIIYIWKRMMAMSHADMAWATIFSAITFIVNGVDFTGDLGYWIGVVMR